MQLFNPRVPKLMLTTALLVSACGTASLSYDEDQQREAVARWSQCIDRQKHSSAVKVVDALETEGDDCQGHKRDVVESYPPHLGPRVEEMLKERRQRRAAVQLLEVSNPQTSVRPVLLVRDAPTH